MKVENIPLEEWMRDYYFNTDIDIGSSGVKSLSLAQIRAMTGLQLRELDEVVFNDSLTLGGPGIRDVIGRRMADGDTDRVMVTHGSSEAIFLTMNALLRPGDEVITVDPAYQQLFATGTSIGCTLKRWPLRFEDGFRPDLAELRRLVTSSTRLVVVNFPHNPTGVSITPQEQRELVEIVAEVGAYLVWDSAFGEITYGGEPLPDPGGWYSRTVTYGTLSKTYGLPGLRVGWCLASPDVLVRCAQLRDYVSLHLSPLVELIAEHVIANGDRFASEFRPLATKNLQVLASWVNDNAEHVEWVRPQGGVCTFVRLPGVADVEAFCRQLARERKVLLVPGTCFGRQGYARLGFGAATSELEIGLACLTETLQTYSR
jgi:capreomycidine synthase